METRDRISQLPDDILELIVKKLTLRDAARTSILSHRWKHVWLFRPPNLILDKHNLLKPSERETCSGWKDLREKFVTVVNQFLESYQRSTNVHRIISSRVRFHLRHDLHEDDIGKWVRFAISRGAEDLSLDMCTHKTSLPFRGRKYILPEEVFDGAENNLKKLKLVRCSPEKPVFDRQFSSLESLIMNCVHAHDLGNMFSYLGNLKFLKIRNCTLPEVISLGSLHLLKSFHISKCFGLEVIELSNPSLFEFDCYPCRLTKIRNGVPNFKYIPIFRFNFNGFPKLEALYYHGLTGGQLQSFFTSFRHHLPILKTLHLSTGSVWRKFIPKSFTIFGTVTELKLYFSGYTKFDILKLLSILKAFLSLRKFYLLMHCPEDLSRQMRINLGRYVNKSLEHVEIRGFYNTPMQIKFAIYLLKNAVSLKKLVIIQKQKKKKAWDEDELQKIREELKKFSKDRELIVQ